MRAPDVISKLSAQSPAAYTFFRDVCCFSSVTTPRLTSPPASLTSSVFGRTPTATTRISKGISFPLFKCAVLPSNFATLSER